jgi:hypothetical protein
MWLGGAALVALLVLTAAVAIIAHRFEPFVRARIVQGLQDRFHTHVELSSFHIAPGNGLHGMWGVWATGRGLKIWAPQVAGSEQALETTPNTPPVIQLDQFSFHVPLGLNARTWTHISQVRLEGLNIHVPPRSQRGSLGVGKPSAGKASGLSGNVAGQQGAPSDNTQVTGPEANRGVLASVVIDRIDCDHAQLVLETDKPNKLPLGFAITHMRLTHVTSGGAMGYEADIDNPKPQGVVHATGSFGPWATSDPGESPLSGAYRFEHADLASFKGIAGILFSTGRFEGTLRDIIVDGEANVPDFRLTHFGNPMALHTKFHARVDGTDGDTWLDPVDAVLGRSHFTTEGQVVRLRAPVGAAGPVTGSETERAALFEGGHVIDLKVNVDRGHIEDFLHLASHSATPLLTGNVTVKATLHIPPGKEQMHERIKLDGAFKLDQVHFTSDKIQGRIESLSLRGQGKPGELKTANADDVSSEMDGSFHMQNAVIALPDLKYNVPGAAIELNGTYALDGALNFTGVARMQATVSQMVGGWKGFLLKPADRFFKKDGAGTKVGIRIKGTRESPEFGVDLGGMKTTSPEKPGQKQ